MKKKNARSWHEVTPLSRKLALIGFLLFPIVSFFLGRMYQKSLDVDQFTQERMTAQAEQTSQFETSELPTGICIPSVEMVNGSDQTDVSNSADAL